MSAATVFIISLKFWFLVFMSKNVLKKQDFEIKECMIGEQASHAGQIQLIENDT